MSDSADRLAVIFARRLRAEEMAIPTGSVALFVSALSELDPADRDSLYWAGRAVLVHRPEDIDTFDRVFRSVWLHQSPDARLAAIAANAKVGVDHYLDPETEDDTEQQSQAPATVVHYSPVEVLRSKDFGEYTAADFADPQRLMAGLRATAAMRRSRRRRPAKRRRHPQPDIRATVRRGCAPVGSPSAERGTRRRCNRAGLSCYVMSAALWILTPGRCCGSCTRRWLVAAAWRPSPWEHA